MKNDLVAVWLGVCFAALSMSLFAHHGTITTYDVSKTVVLKGTVTSFKFGNPHIEILLDVKDETGKVVSWNVEGPGVYIFSKAGWTRNALKAGDQMTATINPSRSGNPIGVAIKLVTAAGKELVIEAGK